MHIRECVVKVVDSIGTTHSVRVRAESVYQALLIGLKQLNGVGWEGNGKTVEKVTVEAHFEPTVHEINFPNFLRWLNQHGLSPRDENMKQELRQLLK